MQLINLKNISLSYGHQVILDQISLSVEKKERICLVGRNGAGKSTLMKVIRGAVSYEDGEFWSLDTLRIAYLEQDLPEIPDSSVFEVIAGGLGNIGAQLARYHVLTQKQGDQAVLDELAELQHQIELHDGWNINQKVETVISRLGLPEDTLYSHCSGGMKRRVLLAKALVTEPDLLLLDEPTNHMDISAIAWLEEFLLAYQGALMFITHDRTFLENVATRIVELERGRLFSFDGKFSRFLQKKEEILENESKQNRKFDKKLAEYEQWIRQGIKARRKRNQGRVKQLMEMRAAKAARLKTQGQVSLTLDAGAASGKLVADLRKVEFGYDNQPIINEFSSRILRGDRVGIIGPNGSGKSTLLKLILGELTPASGEVVLGTKLEVAYFDQQRQQLDMDKTVRDNISHGQDYISVKGRSRHVIGYLKDFLFPPDKIDCPVKILSGGERNRLLLARLFTLPANLLVLDEPTNDLDVDTLELLEDLLSEFNGTLLLVSHDRAFLDNVVTSTIVIEKDGHIEEYVGGYQDYLRQRKSSPLARMSEDKTSKANEPDKKPSSTGQNNNQNNKQAKQKLSFNEQRELKQLPEQIEAHETELDTLEQEISQADFYQQDKQQIKTTLDRVDELREKLSEAYARWEYLEQYE